MLRRVALTALIWAVRITDAISRRFPRRARVVLATAHTAAIRGDLAAIRDELRRRHPEVPIVELVHDRRPGLLGRARAIAQSLEAAYHIATARLFIVDSHFLPLYLVRRRPGTTVVQTWHACGAIKKIGYSVVNASFGADETLTGMIRIHSNYDICLAASRAAVEQYVDAFRQPASLFVTSLGMPRTDVLLQEDRAAAVAAAVRERYRLPEGKRVILYAPTFRGDSLANARDPESIDLHLLARTLRDDHVLLVRPHPAVRSALAIDGDLAGFAIDVSDYPEANDLLLVTDVLVTDYSSVIFEFALLGRPMAFYAPDTDAYERERGFYFDYRRGVPGEVFETTDALAAHLRAGVFDLERVRAFARTWFEVADGHAAERFVERVVRPALAARPIDVRRGPA